MHLSELLWHLIGIEVAVERSPIIGFRARATSSTDTANATHDTCLDVKPLQLHTRPYSAWPA